MRSAISQMFVPDVGLLSMIPPQGSAEHVGDCLGPVVSADLDPLTHYTLSGSAAYLHVTFAVLALAVGIGIFTTRRGTPGHRKLGYGYMAV